MELVGLLIVLLLIGLLILGVIGMVRGNRVRSCCDSRRSEVETNKFT